MNNNDADSQCPEKFDPGDEVDGSSTRQGWLASLGSRDIPIPRHFDDGPAQDQNRYILQTVCWRRKNREFLLSENMRYGPSSSMGVSLHDAA